MILFLSVKPRLRDQPRTSSWSSVVGVPLRGDLNRGTTCELRTLTTLTPTSERERREPDYGWASVRANKGTARSDKLRCPMPIAIRRTADPIATQSTGTERALGSRPGCGAACEAVVLGGSIRRPKPPYCRRRAAMASTTPSKPSPPRTTSPSPHAPVDQPPTSGPVTTGSCNPLRPWPLPRAHHRLRLVPAVHPGPLRE